MTNPNVGVLQREFSGELILPGDSAYQQARSVFGFEGAPALVMRPATTRDVAEAIHYARSSGLPLSIRSGGHSMAGFGTNRDGLVLDLSSLNQIEVVDPDRGIVRVGGGATWGRVAETLQEHQLALSSGDTKSVGVGGLTLGGGIGWMVRKYGLTIDSMRAAEVVTADGEIRRASAKENADLFWALRGGGGNFGVVTRFDFEAHRLGRVVAGTIAYPLDNLPELLQGWRDAMRQAPEDLTTSFTVMPAFGDFPPSALVMVCYAGDDAAAAARALEPLKQLGTIAWENVTEKNYADVLEVAQPPAGVRAIVRNLLAPTFSDELIDAIVATRDQPGGRVLQIRSLGGAVKRVAPDATAFAHRNSEIMMFGATFVPPTAPDEAVRGALQPWETLTRFGQGAYANFIGDPRDEDVTVIYPQATYDRLARIKRAYDPDNLFARNFNIKPAD